MSSISDLVRVKELRVAAACGAGSTVRRDSRIFEKLLLELLGSRAKEELGGVGGVSRAATGCCVEDSIVASCEQGKSHTTLEIPEGYKQSFQHYCGVQRSVQRRCNQDSSYRRGGSASSFGTRTPCRVRFGAHTEAEILFWFICLFNSPDDSVG